MGGTALAKRGDYYLFRFVERGAQPAQVNIEGLGLFKVELIDTAGPQAFVPVLVPSILRITHVSATDSTMSAVAISQLFSALIGDTAMPNIPSLRPFIASKEHYSAEFAMYQLMADVRTRAVLQKYAPAILNLAKEFSIAAIPPLASFASTNSEAMMLESALGRNFALSPEELAVVTKELAEIPLE
jgi:hypothetical protein